MYNNMAFKQLNSSNKSIKNWYDLSKFGMIQNREVLWRYFAHNMHTCKFKTLVSSSLPLCFQKQEVRRKISMQGVHHTLKLLKRLDIDPAYHTVNFIHNPLIMKTCLFKYTENFTTKKKKKKKSDKKFWYISYFYSKHRLWVLVRTASARRF